jgi:hypothetical protein
MVFPESLVGLCLGYGRTLPTSRQHMQKQCPVNTNSVYDKLALTILKSTQVIMLSEITAILQ